MKIMHTRCLRYIVASIIIFELTTTKNVKAIDLTYEVNSNIEYSDNVRRANENPINTWTGIVGASANYSQQASNYAINIRPEFLYRNYRNEQLEDRLYLDLDATLLLDLKPNSFLWSFENYLTQTTVDIMEPDTPFNLQQTNLFSTGPDFNYRINKGRNIEFRLRYLDFYYEISNTDNKRFGVLTSIKSNRDAVTQNSINFDYVVVKYQDGINNDDYNRADAYFSQEKIYENTEYRIDLGYTGIKRRNSGNLGGAMANLRIEKDINSRSGVFVAGYVQYTDSSRNFLFSRAYRDNINPIGAAVTSYIYYEKLLSVQYRWSGTVNNWNFDYSYSDQDYGGRNNDLDRRFQQAGILYTRNISVLMSMGLSARFTKTNYLNYDSEDKDKEISASIQYRLSRSFTSMFQYSRSTRDSTEIARNYLENRAVLSLVYNNRH